MAKRLDALADAFIAVLPERADTAYGRLTGMAYSLIVQDMKAKIHAVTAENFELGAAWLAEALDLAVPANTLVVALHALMEGLTFQRLLTPDLVPDSVIRVAFRVIAKGARQV